jgi:hypothetical protein
METITDQQKAQACADAFKPMAEVGQPIKVTRNPTMESNRTNCRIVIPINDHRFGQMLPWATVMSYADATLKDVKRHIDNSEQAGIEWDSEQVCPSCNRTMDCGSDGFPWCCNDAQALFLTNNPHVEVDEGGNVRLKK